MDVSTEIVAGDDAARPITIRRARGSAERRFYMGFTLALIAAVLLGFSRTFFLRPWFPEWASAHGAPETFFYVHGTVFTAWFVMLLAQVSLVAAGRVDRHRKLGWAGAVLAVAMVVVGTLGALIAARRPTGFMDLPIPPLQFLLIPLGDIVAFGTFVALGIATRRVPQTHKRCLLLASVSLLGAAIGRWPFAFVTAPFPVPGFAMADVLMDLFLVPLLVWDLVSRGRVHPITLWGGLALIASQPLRAAISTTDTWTAVAARLVALLG